MHALPAGKSSALADGEAACAFALIVPAAPVEAEVAASTAAVPVAAAPVAAEVAASTAAVPVDAAATAASPVVAAAPSAAEVAASTAAVPVDAAVAATSPVVAAAPAAAEVAASTAAVPAAPAAPSVLLSAAAAAAPAGSAGAAMLGITCSSRFKKAKAGCWKHLLTDTSSGHLNFLNFPKLLLSPESHSSMSLVDITLQYQEGAGWHIENPWKPWLNHSSDF